MDWTGSDYNCVRFADPMELAPLARPARRFRPRIVLAVAVGRREVTV